MSYRSFITPRMERELQHMVRRGFETVLSLSDPPVQITLYRTNETTGKAEAQQPVDVVLLIERAGAVLPPGDDSSEYTMTGGWARAFAPWDVRVGDRFKMPDGQWAIVTSVAPVRWGVVRAAFVFDEGAG